MYEITHYHTAPTEEETWNDFWKAIRDVMLEEDLIIDLPTDERFQTNYEKCYGWWKNGVLEYKRLLTEYKSLLKEYGSKLTSEEIEQIQNINLAILKRIEDKKDIWVMPRLLLSKVSERNEILKLYWDTPSQEAPKRKKAPWLSLIYPKIFHYTDRLSDNDFKKLITIYDKELIRVHYNERCKNYSTGFLNIESYRLHEESKYLKKLTMKDCKECNQYLLSSHRSIWNINSYHKIWEAIQQSRLLTDKDSVPTQEKECKKIISSWFPFPEQTEKEIDLCYTILKDHLQEFSPEELQNLYDRNIYCQIENYRDTKKDSQPKLRELIYNKISSILNSKKQNSKTI